MSFACLSAPTPTRADGVEMDSLVIDQIYDSDYKHLKPEKDELFSEDDEEEELGAEGESGKKERGNVGQVSAHFPLSHLLRVLRTCRNEQE